MAFLLDSKVQVCRRDPQNSAKCTAAVAGLLRGVASGELVIVHQSRGEFVNSAIPSRSVSSPWMTRANATRQAELFRTEFSGLYPDEHVFRSALRGMGAYELAGFNVHPGYAERYRFREIRSEDSEPGRMYGTVRIRNPFVALGLK